MVRCAVVEDERENRDMLRDYIFRFNREKNILLWPFFYSNAAEFLSSAEKYDLVLMDIRMPGLNGMDAARILRERDEGVQIVFITSLASYALQGYEVGALNYIVKPVSYPDFALKLARTLKRVTDSRTDIHISGRGKVINLSADEIFRSLRPRGLLSHLRRHFMPPLIPRLLRRRAAGVFLQNEQLLYSQSAPCRQS